MVVVLVSTRTSANDSTTHESTLHDGFFVGDFWCAKEDTITRARAREGLSMRPLLTPPKESSIPCSLRNNSSRRDRKNGHVMMRFSIFLGKIGRGFRRGFVVLQICIKERGVLWFLEEKLLGILVFIGSMILMNLLCFFAR